MGQTNEFAASLMIDRQAASIDSPKDSGAGGRWFESSHPDQCLHESDLPGVALSFCSPIHVWYWRYS